jgi:hypothetical protein
VSMRLYVSVLKTRQSVSITFGSNICQFSISVLKTASLYENDINLINVYNVTCNTSSYSVH